MFPSLSNIILTEEVLKQYKPERVGGGYAVEKIPPLPIDQVKIDWILDYAKIC
jgi:hypothetical protein